jgi:hypothetical protein
LLLGLYEGTAKHKKDKIGVGGERCEIGKKKE